MFTDLSHAYLQSSNAGATVQVSYGGKTGGCTLSGVRRGLTRALYV